MNSKILLVTITIVAVFGVAGVVGLASVTAAPVMAQDNNITMGGNMTGGNMTEANITQTGSISGCGNECF